MPDQKSLPPTIGRKLSSPKLDPCSDSHYNKHNVIYCNTFVTCKYSDEYQKYSTKLLCNGINLVFNPVAYIVNTAVFDKENIPKFVEKVNNDPSLLESYTQLALYILNGCLPKAR